MPSPRTGYHSVTPRLVVNDVSAQVEFLRRVFGASGEPEPGRPVEMRIGDSLLMISATTDREAFPGFLYVYVEDAERAYNLALEAGATSLEAPLDTPYGDRRAMVRDPFGNVFQIAHPIDKRSSMTPRIPPIPFQQWPPEITGMLSKVTRDDGPPQEATQKAKNMIGTLAHHPPLAKALLPFNGHILRATTLTERQRELLVLRVSVLRKSSYTWAEHVPMARNAGLQDEEIGRIAYGPDAPYWDPLDAAVLRSVDELVADGMVSDQTWAALSEHLDADQLLDLIFTVGTYQMLAGMICSFQLGLDDDLRPS